MARYTDAPGGGNMLKWEDLAEENNANREAASTTSVRFKAWWPEPGMIEIIEVHKDEKHKWEDCNLLIDCLSRQQAV